MKKTIFILRKLNYVVLKCQKFLQIGMHVIDMLIYSCYFMKFSR